MELQFISHAGFIVTANGRKIFTDPWTRGKAFNNSWSLLSKPVEVDYGTIDYIFITHEHPDHFSFPTLKAIPDADKKRIRIIYQKHASLRLVEAFQQLGFTDILELPVYQWTAIDGIRFYCGSVGSIDSFLAISAEGQTILNLNDCVLNKKQYRYIREQIGSIDLLLTQFSFANWVGNDQDQVRGAEKKVDDIMLQLRLFKPTFTVPFASFVYFCNAENERMNAWVNTPAYIQSLQLKGLNFMYSGDKVDLKSPAFHPEEAIRKYDEDLLRLNIDPPPPTVPLDEIRKSALNSIRSIQQKIPYLLRRMIKPVSIYIHDLNAGITIDFVKGTITDTDPLMCRYIMCSQVCDYTFRYSWGGATLQVSGMYRDKLFPAPASRFFFFQNLISSSYIDLGSLKGFMRTCGFFWRKKWELLYRIIK